MNKQINDKGFTVVEILVIIVVIVGLGFAGWRVYENHHKIKVPSLAAKTNPPTVTTSYAKGLNLVLSTYNTYDDSGMTTAIKSNLTPDLYNKITNNQLGYDPVTCGQGLSVPFTGGNALNRVAVEGGSTSTTLIVQVDELTEQVEKTGGYYYYSVGPSVTVDLQSLKISTITCNS